MKLIKSIIWYFMAFFLMSLPLLTYFICKEQLLNHGVLSYGVIKSDYYKKGYRYICIEHKYDNLNYNGCNFSDSSKIGDTIKIILLKDFPKIFSKYDSNCLELKCNNNNKESKPSTYLYPLLYLGGFLW